MKTIKYLLLFVLTVNLFSCSDDDAPPCIPTIWYEDADNDTLGNSTVSVQSCSQPDGYVGNGNDLDDTDPLNLDPIITASVANLHAPQTGGQGQGPIGGAFTKFDFSTGEITTSTTEWDIAFRGTTIVFNGGNATGTADEPERNGDAKAYIDTETFENVSGVIVVNFSQDSANGLAIPTGSGNGWYTYDTVTHLINPTTNKTIVIQTRDGKYAKVKIRNYYNNLDSSDYANARYYTFDYVYQPNEGIATF